VPILLLATVTQVIREAWPDVALFSCSVLLIAWEARRPGHPSTGGIPETLDHTPVEDSARRVWSPWLHGARSGSERALVAASVGAVGLALGWFPRTDSRLTAGMAVIGILAVGGVLAPHPQGDPVEAVRRPGGAALPAGWVLWFALTAALAAVELTAFLAQADPRVDDPAHPTVSATVEPWLDSPAGRGAFLVLWLFVGWWLVRRCVIWRGSPHLTTEAPPLGRHRDPEGRR
jgi:hypothetical protein